MLVVRRADENRVDLLACEHVLVMDEHLGLFTGRLLDLGSGLLPLDAPGVTNPGNLHVRLFAELQDFLQKPAPAASDATLSTTRLPTLYASTESSDTLGVIATPSTDST